MALTSFHSLRLLARPKQSPCFVLLPHNFYLERQRSPNLNTAQLRCMEYIFLPTPVCIKEEVPDQESSLISSPLSTTSTGGHSLPSVPSTSHRRGSVSGLSGRRHSRPYPLLERGVTFHKHPGDTMSGYPSWSGSSGRRQHQGERGTPAPDDQGYRMPQQYANDPYMSSSSSSLMGAMGEMSLHPRQSHSSRSGHVYSGNTTGSELGSWNASPHMQPNITVAMSNTTYPGVAGHGGFGVTYPGVASSSNAEISLGDYGQSTPAIGYGAQQVAYSASPSSSSDVSDEVQRLRRRVHELERELNRSKSTAENLRNTIVSSGLPVASSSQTASFQSSWHARTEARKQIYCSLNRAGNALCAWHDSRRERRAYPPRNAPPGHLNCGCTYEEALFEESLARHGVGSYLPGDMVRMDPALRNPLLKLLQRRYGYKDGDFEHNPVSLTWAEGESPATWEKKAQGGAVVKRRTESDRH